MMTNFDATGREFCDVAVRRTNTPIQALNLMNDVTFMEAARALATSLIKDTDDDQERLKLAFQKVLLRSPDRLELSVLRPSIQRYRRRYLETPAAAKQLLAATGNSALPMNLDEVELATWTLVCSTLLNLDEAVTKE